MHIVEGFEIFTWDVEPVCSICGVKAFCAAKWLKRMKKKVKRSRQKGMIFDIAHIESLPSTPPGTQGWNVGYQIWLFKNAYPFQHPQSISFGAYIHTH